MLASCHVKALLSSQTRSNTTGIDTLHRFVACTARTVSIAERPSSAFASKFDYLRLSVYQFPVRSAQLPRPWTAQCSWRFPTVVCQWDPLGATIDDQRLPEMVGQQTPDWSSGSLKGPLAILYDNGRKPTARVVNEFLQRNVPLLQYFGAPLAWRSTLKQSGSPPLGEGQGGGAP